MYLKLVCAFEKIPNLETRLDEIVKYPSEQIRVEIVDSLGEENTVCVALGGGEIDERVVEDEIGKEAHGRL